jgi:hypothetical protein
MESTLQNPDVIASGTTPNAWTIVYWIVTALFCLQVAAAFTHLGFPGYFRMDLSWAKSWS